MQYKRNIAAVVLAAGYSSRMGRFKPLLPLCGEPLIRRQVCILREAGIGDIRVVVGHSRELLLPALEGTKVHIVENPGFSEGMYSSVKAAAWDLIARPVGYFALLPVDVPLLCAEVLSTLLDAAAEGNDAIIYPCYRGRRGHPPILPGTLAAEILSWRGEGGLRKFLETCGTTSLDVETGSPYVLFDMDTEADYKNALRYCEEQNTFP